MAIVTQTENFVYETAAASILRPLDFGAAWARANALVATCEADLATLQKWFGIQGGFGPANKVTVLVDGSILPGALGKNFGYASDGTTKIIVTPFSTTAGGDAAARAVFVAEMSEVLMDQRNQRYKRTTWIANYSTGEALSTVCEALIHPEGYYAPVPPLGPRIWKWLSVIPHLPYDPGVARENWIDRTDDTDQNFASIGCGVLFLYYLLSEKGYSIQDIIAQGGSTLEETYHNLTGQSGGWKAFSDLLEPYFPTRPFTIYSPAQDNVFPLPKPAALTFDHSTVVAGGSVNATLSFDAVIPGAALTVSVSSEDDPAFVIVPKIVQILPGTQSTNFVVSTPASPIAFKAATVTVSARFLDTTVSARLIIEPSVTVGVVKGLTLNPATVVGGHSSQGTVTLESPVGTNTIVGLAALETGSAPGPHSGHESAIASVPPSVTVPANQASATFTVKTTDVVLPAVTRTATIVAGAVVTKSAVLTVERS